MRKRIDSHKCSDVKPWVIAAIEDEERCRSDQMWKDEPTAESIGEERLRQIKFLRKHGNTHPDALVVAKRLESCEPKHRCLSAACPECERLFQRWFVRRSRKFIARHIALPGNWLVAVSIVPSGRIIPPGQLSVLDIAKLQRRLKYALKKTKIRVALGGIDFSLNEDREGKYQPFWCPHVYLITSTKNKNKLGNKLRRIYLKSEEVRVPVKITSLENNAYRRSYALKMHFKRRIGYLDIKCKHEKIRECRNASRDKLRAAERLELFIYLDKIGLASRVILWGAKPVVNSPRVKIERC
jgi:hypothetical protein